MPRRLLIATSNSGKLREIQAVLSDLELVPEGLKDYADLPDVVEDAATFMGNAEKKALHFAKLTGLLTLADDSGLEVDCLGGQPGVYSARFAGQHGDDQGNNAKLIQLLENTPHVQRTARFRCAVAVADGQRILARAEGCIEGLIIDTPRGQSGFGYDPHFLIPELDKTTAELDADHKNRISHRGQALLAIRDELAKLVVG